MKYLPLKQEFFRKNRDNYVSRLKNASIALFFSNDEYTRSGDQTYAFRQNPDFFYLSGIDQEQSILLLFPHCPNPLYREVLFLRQTNPHIAVWEGHKYTKEEARETSGISAVYWLDQFDDILHSIVNYATDIYINLNENDRYSHKVPYSDIRKLNQLREQYPLHNYQRSAPIMRDLRAVKSDTEIGQIRKACGITRDAFIRVLKFTRPGVAEYEIEAEIIHEFIRQRATGHAYMPIIASGKNAIVLHYNENNQPCRDGDLVLMDFGAEYANYNADMTRTIPVNGRFTARQKAVYTSVLTVLRESVKLLRPGTLWNAYHEEVGKIMTAELISLGLLKQHEVDRQDPAMPLYKKYFMHGNSHHLGLDVHDFAGRYTPFAAGNVLTVEPGIYIPEEGFGIRLENNVLITESGQTDLMADIPIEPEEIETIMNS
ncbi:MAG: aminopeptidase P N-terminal domain-containing protein [Mucilaginibacter polytrichastri]|nr:aminopeptidase P N-terminal domain-containing protein [Mucilaginibacter polytrichastri]